jgi:hypothetical protein
MMPGYAEGLEQPPTLLSITGSGTTAITITGITEYTEPLSDFIIIRQCFSDPQFLSM